MPVFIDDELIAWTANIAHWNDVGGMVPGSISNEAKEIFQEGLRIPAVKLISERNADQVGDGDHEGEQPPPRRSGSPDASRRDARAGSPSR